MVTRSFKRTSSALVLSERGKLSAHTLRRLSGPSLPEPHHTRHDIHSWLAPYHCLATLHPLRLTRRLLAQITRCRKNFVGLLIGIRRSTARGSQCRVPSNLMSLSSTLTPMQTYTFIQKHSLPRKVQTVLTLIKFSGVTTHLSPETPRRLHEFVRLATSYARTGCSGTPESISGCGNSSKQ